MLKLNVLLIFSLTALVSSEVVGLINLTSTMTQDSSRGSVAIAAPARPRYRGSGIKRSLCETGDNSQEELMVFLPDSTGQVDLAMNQTPTLYFYVPEKAENIGKLTFRLRHRASEEEIVSPMQLTAPQKPGVLKVQLPKALEEGKEYDWFLSVKCKSNRLVVAPFVGSIVYRKPSAPVVAQLAKAKSDQEKAEIYKQAGAWVDATQLLMADSQLQSKPFAELIDKIGLVRPPALPNPQ
jgi:hypothetical protein